MIIYVILYRPYVCTIEPYRVSYLHQHKIDPERDIDYSI